MNASFFIDGNEYPVVVVGQRFVLCLPEKYAAHDARVLEYDAMRVTQVLRKREREKP